MEKSQEFLMLLRDYKHLEETLKAKAWEITPDDIKYLLCGERGLMADNKRVALEWLITPNWRLKGRCPAEAITDDKTEEVKELLRCLKQDVYS